MHLQWSSHSNHVMEGLNSLLTSHLLLDIKLSAEGRSIKAHRVVLASVSQYFQDLLEGLTESSQPVIFFRDVKFCDIQHLVQFIYTGSLDIPVTELDSFLSLAQSLGVTGFLNDVLNSSTPSKRKILNKKPAGVKVDNCDKENKAPVVDSSPTKSHPVNQTVNTVHKRRKVLTSLPLTNTGPGPDSEPLYANTPHHQETLSLDSSLLDPDSLAAKGATLLHHLAVWMIQQRQDQPGQSPHPPVPDQMPEPSFSLPARPHLQPERPDSGFDSKDEGVKDNSGDTEGSPEIREISRQAVARQPVVKKKRILHSNLTKYKL